MLKRSSVLLFLTAAYVFAQVTIPNTPAGQILEAWLDAFNSGDRAKIEAYVHAFDPNNSADSLLSFRSRTGGFELLAIETSEPLLIRFRVKEKASPTVGLGAIQVKSGQPATVESFRLHAIPPNAVIENIRLDSAERQRVLDGITANLKDFYVYPDLAQKMEQALQAHQKQRDYDAITDGDAFASRLTSDLQDVSHDKHLRVEYSAVKLPPNMDRPSPEDLARFRKDMERMNCGFQKAEILPNNIGYLKFNMFADPAVCGPTVVAAFNFLAHADAIIFDLRDNGGGDPKMVALISSYLFDQPTHLNDLYNRREDSTTQYWTLPFVPGPRLADKPAFVLTSKATFSGAEEFTYNLKNLKRAKIIGETTGGGAHPVGGHRIDDHFMIGVPYARAINPISKTNWEGTGVQADVPVQASDALETAEKLAQSAIHANGS